MHPWSSRSCYGLLFVVKRQHTEVQLIFTVGVVGPARQT